MFKKMLSVGAIMVGAVTSGFSAVTLPTELNVAPIESLAGLILGALAIIWVIVKVINFMNRGK